MDDDAYQLFTDGSCFGNPGPGGVGVFIVLPLEFDINPLQHQRGYHLTTNNRMEMRAAIDGLRLTRDLMKKHGKRRVEWGTDSKYVADNILEVPRWRKGGEWIRANGEPVLNSDLWKELFNLAHSMSVWPVWISREDNKDADGLAKQAAKHPTHKDLGFNPGRVGKPVGERAGSPNLFEKNEHALVRIYKGDGMVSKTDAKCKIRFELLETSKRKSLGRFYAYVCEDLYHDLHRNHEYILSFEDGEIIEIIECF